MSQNDRRHAVCDSVPHHEGGFTVVDVEEVDVPAEQRVARVCVQRAQEPICARHLRAHFSGIENEAATATATVLVGCI